VAALVHTLGAWDDAVVDADRALAVSTESASGYLHSLAYGAAVAVPATRGDWTTARAHLDEAIAHIDNYERSIVAVGIAGAQLAVFRGDAEAVLAALAPVVGVFLEMKAQFFAQFGLFVTAANQPAQFSKERSHHTSPSAGLRTSPMARVKACHFDCSLASCFRPELVRR